MRQLTFTPMITMLLCLIFFGSQCVMEPDREFIYQDTLVQYDAIKQNVTVRDTVKVYKDTLIHKDTIYTTRTVRDTVWKRDTIHTSTPIHDTLWKKDTLQIHDTIRVTIFKDTLLYHDTVKITQIIHDTIWKRDTIRLTNTIHDTLWRKDTLRIRDTIRIHDTTIVYDTIQTFATTTISSDLVGTWQGTVAGKTVTLTIVTEQSAWAFSYTANIGTSAYHGKIETFSNNIAKCVYMYGPSMIGEDANWMISISNNVMTLQQTGYAMFPTMNAFQLIRIL